MTITITKELGGDIFDAECDGCGGELGCELDTFAGAVEAMKAAGWRLERTGLTWTHLCRECRRAPLAR